MIQLLSGPNVMVSKSYKIAVSLFILQCCSFQRYFCGILFEKLSDIFLNFQISLASTNFLVAQYPMSEQYSNHSTHKT